MYFDSSCFELVKIQKRVASALVQRLGYNCNLIYSDGFKTATYTATNKSCSTRLSSRAGAHYAKGILLKSLDFKGSALIRQNHYCLISALLLCVV